MTFDHVFGDQMAPQDFRRLKALAEAMGDEDYVFLRRR